MSRDKRASATIDLAGTGVSGDGVHWTLPVHADLNANLVALEPGHQVGDHRNEAVDVLLVGVDGTGAVTVDGEELALHALVLVHLPKGTNRRIVAGPEGLRYLTVHRQRGPLGLTPTR